MWEMLTHPSLKNLPDFIRKNQLNTFVLFARRKFIKFILFKVFFEFDKFSASGVFVYWMVFGEWFPACLNALEKEDKWLI